MVNQIEFLSDLSFDKTCTFSRGMPSIDAYMLTNMEKKHPLFCISHGNEEQSNALVLKNYHFIVLQYE
jgi:hypothetical protein